jgi:hypothetical protein
MLTLTARLAAEDALGPFSKGARVVSRSFFPSIQRQHDSCRVTMAVKVRKGSHLLNIARSADGSRASFSCALPFDAHQVTPSASPGTGAMINVKTLMSTFLDRSGLLSAIGGNFKTVCDALPDRYQFDLHKTIWTNRASYPRRRPDHRPSCN